MENTSQKDAVQQVLDGRDEILESVCITRKDRFDQEILVVYLVPAILLPLHAGCFTLDDFFSASGQSPEGAQSILKVPSDAPIMVVLVNAIPRDQSGAVDETSLNAIPVLDAGLVADWSNVIRSNKSIENVAVISVLRHRETEFLHRADIFQFEDWSTSQPGFRIDDKSTKSSPKAGVSATGSSSRPAEVHADGQLFSDRLDEKYGLSLANTLYRAAEISPDKGIQYIDHAGHKSFQAYPELLEQAQNVLAGLQASGIQKADKVLLQCADNRQFLTVFWACILGGMIPVPMSVAPSYTKDNAVVLKLLNVWQVFEQPVIICSDNLVEDFDRLYEDSDLSERHVIAYQQLSNIASTAAAIVESDIAPDALTLLLLTSGSTGTPKAVMHTHQTLINRSAATSALNQFHRQDVSLNWMPLDHVGGIVMFHLRDVYNACSQVQVATSWILEQPLRWLDTIDTERASITWSPNFGFALINDHAGEIENRNWDLSCMRFILNGGEAVVARTASQFLRLLEKSRLPRDSMKPAWGMSETASGVCYSHNFTVNTTADADGAVEVGNPIPNTSLRIVDSQNRVLDEGEKGNLQIKGASVTPGYYLNPEANQKAFTADNWFDTGDAGVIGNGRLTITARIKDEIVINGVNHSAAEIESIAESVPGVEVSFTAACAVRRPNSNTDALVILFCPNDRCFESVSKLVKRIQETVSFSSGVKPELVVPLSQSQVPKTIIGKIQRSLLKQKLEQGEFDGEVKTSEGMLGVNLIPDWFYKKSWYPNSLSIDGVAQALPKQCLVFCDSGEFAKALREKVTGTGMQMVTVSIADEFKILDKNSYGVNPDSGSDYRILMQALQRSDFHPNAIVHCWTYTGSYEIKQPEDLPAAQSLGVYSLLKILQALSVTNTTEKPSDLYVVSSEVQHFGCEDKPLNPHASLTGLLNTAPFEFDWLSVKHIDFPVYRTAGELTAQVEALLKEMVSKNRQTEIVYREAQRYEWQLIPERFISNTLSTFPIKRGGIVLITGGLGGIGAYLAAFLSKQFESKLILLGRTELPARDQWPGILEQGGKLAERITRYIEIEKLGGELVYSAVNVADQEHCEEVILAAEQRWNDELNAVFHLAVDTDIAARWNDESGYEIAHESTSSFENVFASKVYGSYALAQIVSQRNSTIMVSFGSVIGIFGAARYASYAAAHTFLSQLNQHKNQKMPGRFYQFDWAVWEDIGLSQQEPTFAADFYRSIGYSLIPASTGLDCLMAGLSYQAAELIVGLDADKWAIRQHLPFEPQSMQELVACYAGDEPISELQSSLEQTRLSESVLDRFNRSTECKLIQLEQLPELKDGKPDVIGLRELIENTMTAGDSKPGTDLEKNIATYWCEILDLSSPGIHSSFFQMGGNSLTATQLVARLKQAFNVHLEIRDLFDAATISDLAILIERRQIISGRNELAVVTDEKNNDVDSLTDFELLANIDQLSEEKVAELLATMQEKGES